VSRDIGEDKHRRIEIPAPPSISSQATLWVAWLVGNTSLPGRLEEACQGICGFA
jgi:hypothetical protein